MSDNDIKTSVLNHLINIFPQLPIPLLLQVILDTIQQAIPFCDQDENFIKQSCVNKLLELGVTSDESSPIRKLLSSSGLTSQPYGDYNETIQVSSTSNVGESSREFRLSYKDKPSPSTSHSTSTSNTEEQLVNKTPILLDARKLTSTTSSDITSRPSSSSHDPNRTPDGKKLISLLKRSSTTSKIRNLFTSTSTICSKDKTITKTDDSDWLFVVRKDVTNDQNTEHCTKLCTTKELDNESVMNSSSTECFSIPCEQLSHFKEAETTEPVSRKGTSEICSHYNVKNSTSESVSGSFPFEVENSQTDMGESSREFRLSYKDKPSPSTSHSPSTSNTEEQLVNKTPILLDASKLTSTSDITRPPSSSSHDPNRTPDSKNLLSLLKRSSTTSKIRNLFTSFGLKDADTICSKDETITKTDDSDQNTEHCTKVCTTKKLDDESVMNSSSTECFSIPCEQLSHFKEAETTEPVSRKGTSEICSHYNVKNSTSESVSGSSAFEVENSQTDPKPKDLFVGLLTKTPKTVASKSIPSSNNSTIHDSESLKGSTPENALLTKSKFNEKIPQSKEATITQNSSSSSVIIDDDSTCEWIMKDSLKALSALESIENSPGTPRAARIDKQVSASAGSPTQETLIRQNEPPSQLNEPAKSYKSSAKSHEASNKSNEPSAKSNEPSAKSNEAPVTSNQPSVKSNEAPATSNKPSVESNEVPVKSNQSPEKSKFSASNFLLQLSNEWTKDTSNDDKDDDSVSVNSKDHAEDDMDKFVSQVLEIFPDANASTVKYHLNDAKEENPANFVSDVVTMFLERPPSPKNKIGVGKHKKKKVTKANNDKAPSYQKPTNLPREDNLVRENSVPSTSNERLDTTAVNRKRKADDNSEEDAHGIPSLKKAVKRNGDKEMEIIDVEDAIDCYNLVDKMMTCEVCLLKYDICQLAQCCDGHICCSKCIEQEIKGFLNNSVKKIQIGCQVKDCSSYLSLGEICRIMPPLVSEMIKEKLEIENLATIENLDDVVKCPECGYIGEAAYYKEIHCGNKDCMLSFCRFCKRSWNDCNHDNCTALLSTYDKTGSDGVLASYPKFWSGIDTETDKDFICIEVDVNSEEFCALRTRFNSTVKKNIISIIRIQNKKLWQKYALTRKHILDDFGIQKLNEMHLFHGTDPKNIELICQEGFDWRLSGKNGHAIGKGAYFAVNASYSQTYIPHLPLNILNVLKSSNLGLFIGSHRKTDTQSGSKMPYHMTGQYMLVARVVCGRSTVGNSSLLKPPSDMSDSKYRPFNSVTNVNSNPTMFCIFDSAQSYPEYLIEYECNPTIYG